MVLTDTELQQSARDDSGREQQARLGWLGLPVSGGGKGFNSTRLLRVSSASGSKGIEEERKEMSWLPVSPFHIPHAANEAVNSRALELLERSECELHDCVWLLVC